MFWNVVIKKEIEQFEGDSLVFTHFSLDEALKFAKKILKESYYHIEILQLQNEEE